MHTRFTEIWTYGSGGQGRGWRLAEVYPALGLFVREVVAVRDMRGAGGGGRRLLGGECDHRKAKATKIYILFRVVKAKNAQLKEFLRYQLKDLWISGC